ncbi:hypothetical protein [Qipengyuania huizhouensis]|uniref:hypothetical protein n=1 Tax=Qipengyuania huizhouensis TaxID=2867245 RepID=UPI001C87B5D6|nr:hypothetical protein [Qipengyuania huizhouensis]MBX7460814.1 hypothetical protein [Qipengyuania huizhouensis]
MNDRTHDDVGAKVTAIVDDTLADLVMLGLESADLAAELLACQAIVRVKEPEIIGRIADYAESFIERYGGDESEPA